MLRRNELLIYLGLLVLMKWCILGAFNEAAPRFVVRETSNSYRISASFIAAFTWKIEKEFEVSIKMDRRRADYDSKR